MVRLSKEPRVYDCDVYAGFCVIAGPNLAHAVTFKMKLGGKRGADGGDKAKFNRQCREFENSQRKLGGK